MYKNTFKIYSCHWLIESVTAIFNNDCSAGVFQPFISLFMHLLGDHCKYMRFNIAHVDPSLNPKVTSVDAPIGSPRVADYS